VIVNRSLQLDLKATFCGISGCAIRAAIESGKLSEERWKSYMKLMKEARFTDDKDGYLCQKHVWNKELVKWSRRKKGMKD